MYEKLEAVGKAFRLPGKLYAYDTVKNGNINSTYKVTYRMEDGSLKSYVVQKINTNVFKNPEDIMENIDRVTSHMREHYPAEVTLRRVLCQVIDYRLVLDQLEHVSANTADLADEVLGQLRRVNLDFPTTNGAYERIGLIGHVWPPLSYGALRSTYNP